MSAESRSPAPAQAAGSGASWQIVPYEGDSPFKKVRVRDDARIQAILRHLQDDECVVLLGAPLNEKTRLLRDVGDALKASGRYWPLHIDLWRAGSKDETAFFSSMALLTYQALGNKGPGIPEYVPDARSFQNYLVACVNEADRNLALLIDHLQALPPDLVHSLLLALRSAYMEQEADAPRQLVAVVTGSMNLVGLSTGPTSPFNIAKPVVALPLTGEQTLALAEATFKAHGCAPSRGALERIVEWAGGDRYLVPLICAWSAELIQPYRRPQVTRAVIDRAAGRLWLPDRSPPPIREAIRMVEEDPDTMLDVLHLLDQGSLPRAHARQAITRTGTDRLQLSGAVVLIGGTYHLKNLAYRGALARHFTTERVGHVLRIAGRWAEAIDYLTPKLAPHSAVSGQLLATGERLPASSPRIPVSTAMAGAGPQLLEAIVQSIYATDSLEKACEILASGLRLGFGLADVGVYRAKPAQGRLELIYPRGGEGAPPAAVDLLDPERVEAQTFRYGNYALRGATAEARLVATLSTGQRPIGLVTVEHYAARGGPHELPEELPGLLRFLQHAAGAVENVILRAAYRAIGQAVLSASTVQPSMDRVLETVADALGCEFAVLYLVDPTGALLETAAGVGRPWNREPQALARYALSGRHPAAASLREGRIAAVRGTDERLDMAVVDRLGLHKYVRVFLPLQAAGDRLGVLELGYPEAAKISLAEENRRTLTAFADQVAIAVHNMQLLRRTDEALARRVDELEKLRSSSLAISSTLDLDAVLAGIVRDVRALFPGMETTIWEYQPEQAELTALHSSLEDPDYCAQRLDLHSIPGQAVTSRRLRVEPDLSSLPAATVDPAVRLGLRGMTAVPLISRDRVFGVISLYTYSAPSQPIGAGETDLLGAFAAQAAVAIDNARLHQEEVARQRLEEELKVGRQIQLSMLPKECPQAPGWQFAAAYQAARIVGGDFYDFYELPGKPARLGVVIADVSDKGVPAALFMALSRTVIRTTALSGRGPDSALLRANELILKDSQSEMFLSAVYAVLELESGRVIYANAGHNRPLRFQAAGATVTTLGARGTILGILEEIELEEGRIDLAAGDGLVFFTDGITEALDPDGEMFGEERLMEVVAVHGAGSADDLLRAILDALADFTGETEQGDDVTCVVVKRGQVPQHTTDTRVGHV